VVTSSTSSLKAGDSQEGNVTVATIARLLKGSRKPQMRALARRPRRVPPTMESRVVSIVERIRAIPEGFVRTYGDIEPGAPRLVGHVLATTQESMPWHRVVRADGSLTQGRRQRALLVAEGVPMRGDRVDLRRARIA